MGSPGRYRYLLSLPERTVRSLGALSGGLLKEIGEIALPAAIRRTTLYRTMVGVTLRFLIEDLGEVEGIYPKEEQLAENFILQRTAGHGIELLGILAFRASPVWVLAALADVTGGGQRLIREIVEALKEEGLLERDAAGFDTVEQILGGLEKTSAHLAETLNVPPVNVDRLRVEWNTLREGLKSIPPERVPAIERLETSWAELRQAAERQNRSVFAVSSLMAVSSLAHVPGNVLWLSKAVRSAAKRTGGMLGAAILDHYSDALREMETSGFVGYWRREFRPYLRAAAEQFSPERISWTERLMRLRRRRG